MQPTHLRQEIAAVFGEIVAARQLVRAGRTIELAGLDRRIAGLCETVVILPPDERRDLLPLLEDLRLSLDELAGALKSAASADDPGPR
jgi:hypothetical protein